MRVPTLTLAALLLGACAGHATGLDAAVVAPDTAWSGPDAVTVDLLRTGPDGPRIYVQADLGDGQPRLFLVDTGADVNVLHRDVAEDLGLVVLEDRFQLAGLGGRTSAGLAVLERVHLGQATLNDVPFAVGVRGVSEYAGFMPMAGILGMETWKHFVLEIDYPKDRITLHRPRKGLGPRRAAPLHFDGAKIEAAIGVRTRGEDPIQDTVVVQLDTGASALLLSGGTGVPFAGAATEGLEPVYGVGASEFMPPSRFLRKTRRIPIDRVTLGARTFDVDIQAQWINYDHESRTHDLNTRGLIGHRLLAGHRVWIDPHAQRLSLARSFGPRRRIDGHVVVLDQDVERYGDDAPERDLFRARLLVALDRFDEAVTCLNRWVESHPADAEGRVLLARARRYEADLDGAWEALRDLGPGGLVDESEIIAAVNGLGLQGHHEQAIALARRAIAERPDEAEGRVALADALMLAGRFEDAKEQLLQAASLMQNPDAWLLRRARIAMAQGDRFGALALVRKLVQEYPTEGKFLWYYATLLQNDAEVETFRADMERAVGRLHPDLRPLDFLVAAHHAIGDDAQARRFLHEGLERDCGPMKGVPEAYDNCWAWYNALAGEHLDEALSRVRGALAETGPRGDYLDTHAVVLLQRGDLVKAHEAALTAARLIPDDVYMLWQAERIEVMLREQAVSGLEP